MCALWQQRRVRLRRSVHIASTRVLRHEHFNKQPERDHHCDHHQFEGLKLCFHTVYTAQAPNWITDPLIDFAQRCN